MWVYVYNNPPEQSLLSRQTSRRRRLLVFSPPLHVHCLILASIRIHPPPPTVCSAGNKFQTHFSCQEEPKQWVNKKKRASEIRHGRIKAAQAIYQYKQAKSQKSSKNWKQTLQGLLYKRNFKAFLGSLTAKGSSGTWVRLPLSKRSPQIAWNCGRVGKRMTFRGFSWIYSESHFADSWVLTRQVSDEKVTTSRMQRQPIGLLRQTFSSLAFIN